MSDIELEDLFFGRNALLSPFSARIRIGRAIGVYDSSFRAILDTIRRVRNVFAHSIRPITFDHTLVTQACNQLPAPTGRSDPAHHIHPSRDRYLTSCIRSMMTLAAHSASRPAEIDITNLDHAPPTLT